MSFEMIATLGRISDDAPTAATLGRTAKYRVNINDLIEIFTELQTEVEFNLTLYKAELNIETSICTFVDIKTHIKQEVDIETTLALEKNIRTRLVRAYQEPSDL